MTENSSIAEIVIVGGGNMGTALLAGLLDSGRYEPAAIVVAEVVADRRAVLAEQFREVAVVEEVPPCESAVIAVKPGDVAAAAATVARAGATRILSIAAGVRLDTLTAAVAGSGHRVALFRAMPNTPALVGKGASALAAGEGTDETDLDWATEVLSAVGTVDRLGEHALDAFTGVAGSGPAYLFLVAEAMIDAAVGEGLPRTMAERVVGQLFVGSAALLERDGDPARLRAMVTSPGGTTAAGVRELEERAIRAAFADAVRAATSRSRELG